jgi:hypothetical protein
MQVTIKYHDEQSLTVEEVVRNAVYNYGKAVEVEILPDSTKAHDMIYFGLQQMLTHNMLSVFYNDKLSYQTELKKLRASALMKVQEILDQVIIDNESKVIG